MKCSVRLVVSCSRAAVLLLGLASGGCQDQTFAARMRGRTLANVVEELGQPQATTAFPANLSLYEYQMGLRHHIFQAELAAPVVVKESRWPGLLSTHYVWFIQRKNQWVAVDALDWARDTSY